MGRWACNGSVDPVGGRKALGIENAMLLA